MTSPMEMAGRALIRAGALIDGQWVSEGQAVPVCDPANGDLLGHVPDLPDARIQEAILAAHGAFKPWAQTPPLARAAILERWNDLILAQAEGLGALLALENGKPLAEAIGEIRYGASFVHWFAQEALRLDGDVIASARAGERIVTLKEPVGVVGAITPWNFPAAMITRKAAPALAAGCTIVLKPAPQTPFTALALAALALEAGLPPGALHVLTGEAGRIGDALTRSPLVRKISFTGSTAVGRRLAQAAAGGLQRVSLELGGAAPLIVFDDADLEQALAGAIAAKFRNAGQTCVCPNRIYAQAGVFERFVARFAEDVAQLRVGPPFDPGVQIGPLISPAGLAKVEDHVRRACASGARLMTGGARTDAQGRFFQPTVTAGGDDALFCEEETFGPYAPVFRFETEAEVIAAANATPYGLAAYVFTKDGARQWRMASGLEAGVIGINTGITSSALNPFGGMKQSGYGREGSRYGMEDFIAVKSITFTP